MKSIQVFDLWGDLGHFKKPYTITSPLSFAFPPRTTVAGIISAIIGLGKNEYADLFPKKDAHIGLRILDPVKKMRMSQNLIDTKTAKLFSKIKQRTQIRIEYVKDPKYRIYFHHTDKEIFDRLKSFLQRHESVYTVSLGLSELLANFQYVGELGIEKKAKGSLVEIHSIASNVKIEVEFEEGKEYFSATIPLEMGSDRVVTEFGTVLYERNGKTLLAKTKSFFELENGERIVFL
jgi:CRISPR-associated protein Cas5h